MAIVSPYGDPNAHGSIARAISFRRRWGRVVMEKKPYPIQPNSAGQIAQKAAFSAAQTGWNTLSVAQKPYYLLRAPTLEMSERNLYTKAYLLNILPSYTGFYPRQITAAQLMDPIGTAANDLQFVFNVWGGGPPVWNKLGEIWDNENTLKNTATWAGAYTWFQIAITLNIAMPFRYGIALTVLDQSSVSHNFVIRFQEYGTGTKSWYVGDDGSTYHDPSITVFAATNNF